LDDLHRRTTARTLDFGARLEEGQRALRIEAEQILNHGNQPLAVGMQEAEVTGAPESFWQDVLQDQPQELGRGDLPRLGAPAFGLFVAKGHLPIVTGEDVLFPDHAPVEIAPEIDQRLLAGADALAVHNPLFRIALGQREPFAGDGLEHLGPKDLGQGLMIEQIALLARGSLGAPQTVLRIDGGGRNDQMHMRVKVEPTRVRVQDRNRPGGPLEVLVVERESAQRLPGALDQEREEGGLIGEGQRAKGAWQGEGHQEILPRHQLLKLALEPLLTLVVLAVRAAAMPARMRHQDLMVAVGALGEHHGTCRGTAVLHGGQCLEMRR